MKNVLLLFTLLISTVVTSQVVFLGGQATPQQMSLSGNTLLLDGSPSVNLTPYLDNQDNQTITGFTLSGSTITLTIEGGNTVNLDLTAILGTTWNGGAISADAYPSADGSFSIGRSANYFDSFYGEKNFIKEYSHWVPTDIEPALAIEGSVYFDDSENTIKYHNGTSFVSIGGGGGGDALTTNGLDQFAATTSAQLAGVLSDETGTGTVVYSSAIANLIDSGDVGTITSAMILNNTIDVLDLDAGLQTSINDGVTKVGTPVANQIGVWTGGGTIQGITSLTYEDTVQPNFSIDVTGTSAGSPAEFGMSGYTGGTQGARWKFGDNFNTIENQYNQGIVLRSYRTMSFEGGAESLSNLDFTDDQFADDNLVSTRFNLLHDRRLQIRQSTVTARTQPFLSIENSVGTTLAGVDSQGRWTGDGSQLTGIAAGSDNSLSETNQTIAASTIRDINLAGNTGATQFRVTQGANTIMSIGGAGTINFPTGTPTVPAEVYSASWDGSFEAVAKNDVYDKIESISSYVQGMMSDLTTDVTTGADKAFWKAPANGTITGLNIYSFTAGTGTGISVNLLKNNVTILSTNVTTDTGENDSDDATNAHVRTSSTFLKGDVFTWDIDIAPTGAKGVQWTIEWTKS